MSRFAVVFGTRPEAIKLAPIILRLRAQAGCEPLVCVTAQQREMLDQVLEFFGIKPDVDLNLMQPAQTLGEFAGRAIPQLEKCFAEISPDMVLVQGDTSTTFCGSLAAYYRQIPIAHVEAGLRTGDVFSPFPEEANRVLTARLAALHFAPTQRAANNLLQEGVKDDHIFVTGNTGIDALLAAAERIPDGLAGEICGRDLKGRRIVLITAHRRESFGEGFESLCRAIAELTVRRPHEVFIYPAHLNPNVQGPVGRILRPLAERVDNLLILKPLSYRDFVAMMKCAHLILTDSGGIQEEAPGLGKPVLVMRDNTERQEAITAGTAQLVGTAQNVIVQATVKMLDDKAAYLAMARAVNPFGDGKAAERIVARCQAYLAGEPEHMAAAHTAGHRSR